MDPTASSIGLSGWIVVIAYTAGVVALGSYFTKSQRNVEDFFLGGRSFSWLPITLSVIASDLSAISYVGCAAWVYQKDLRYAVGIFFAPLFWAASAYFFLGIFYRHRIYTLYEFLEKRFHVSLRVLASLLFFVKRGTWMAMAMLGASLTITIVMGLPLWLSVVLVGVFSTLYTVLGGMKAIIWTDVVQFIVLVGGAVIATFSVCGEFDWEMGRVLEIARDHGKLTPVTFSVNLQEPVTWFTILIGGMIGGIMYFTSDQLTVQRCFSAKSMKHCIRSGMATGFIALPTMLLLWFLGMLLFCYYETHPAMSAALQGLKAKGLPEPANGALPFYVVARLPGLISGLIVAGIFAATMSSVDSGINSLSTVCVMDFYRRFFHRPHKTEAHYLKVARFGVVFWGALVTVVALLASRVNLGTILQKGGEIAGPFIGPMGGMFILGILTKRANTGGTISGALCGLAASHLLKPHMAFTWYATCGVLFTTVIGYALSVIGAGLGLWRGSDMEEVARYTVFGRGPGGGVKAPAATER